MPGSSKTPGKLAKHVLLFLTWQINKLTLESLPEETQQVSDQARKGNQMSQFLCLLVSQNHLWMISSFLVYYFNFLALLSGCSSQRISFGFRNSWCNYWKCMFQIRRSILVHRNSGSLTRFQESSFKKYSSILSFIYSAYVSTLSSVVIGRELNENLGGLSVLPLSFTSTWPWANWSPLSNLSCLIVKMKMTSVFPASPGFLW